jgi:general L-amino acid transport system substrate-binding protein
MDATQELLQRMQQGVNIGVIPANRHAEELSVSQKTLPQAVESDRAEIRRLLGSYAALGEALGLSNDWAARVIHHVGNYGEVFERNLGSGSRLAIPRGLNRLSTDGGLQYAPPMH